MRWLVRLFARPGPAPNPSPGPRLHAKWDLERALEDLAAAASLFSEATGPVAVDKAIYRLNLAQAEVDEALCRHAHRRELPLPWLVGKSDGPKGPETTQSPNP